MLPFYLFFLIGLMGIERVSCLCLFFLLYFRINDKYRAVIGAKHILRFDVGQEVFVVFKTAFIRQRLKAHPIHILFYFCFSRKSGIGNKRLCKNGIYVPRQTYKPRL